MSKLTIYNNALRILGESPLASLSENREPRRHLDSVWDGGESGAVNYLLEQGLWNFAMRAVKLTPDTSVESNFGYQHTYSKPSDFVRLNKFCTDPNMNAPLLNYQEEGGLWLCDASELYIQYVSNDASFGNDLTLWPATFTKYAEAYLATEIAEALTQSPAKFEKAFKLQRHYRIDARSKDAMEQAPSKLPEGGSFRRARGGSRFSGNSSGGIY